MKEEYMSKEEVEAFENIKVDKGEFKKAKAQVASSFTIEMFSKALLEFEKTLDEDEKIISHVSGGASDANDQRALGSVAGPLVAGTLGGYLVNPTIFQWAMYSTLVRTNKNLYVIERSMYGSFVRSFKLKVDSVKLFYDDRILMQALKEDGKEYNINFQLDKDDRLKEVLGEEIFKKEGSKHKTKWEKRVNKTMIIEILAGIALIVWAILESYC